MAQRAVRRRPAALGHRSGASYHSSLQLGNALALLNQGYLVNVADDGTITAIRADTAEWEHPVTMKGKVHEDGTIAWNDAAVVEKVLFAARIKELQARIDATTYNRA